jgi:hypothetical protein
MTPKEKAIELALKYNNLWLNGNSIMANQCALIAVDEIIEFAYNYTDYNDKSTKEYLKKVKLEIEKL